jgi:hypothetical protein
MSQSHREPDDIEYVGAPTEFADADEVPEWVATAAKILFFLPTAFLTATTIPIIMFAITLLCCLLASALAALL